jgi:hypothetical protein
VPPAGVEIPLPMALTSHLMSESVSSSVNMAPTHLVG